VADTAVVLPTIREDCARRFLAEWRDDLRDAEVIVVEDNPERSFRVTAARHVSWAEIGADLGDDARIIPRRSSAIRSYGTLLAVRSGARFIWHLDDDCYPECGMRGGYLQAVEGCLAATVPQQAWWNTTSRHEVHPRGFPYGIRGAAWPVMVHHGLWSGVPDLDGRTQLGSPALRFGPAELAETVPAGQLFPMCGMNLAFRRDAAPLMYMLLMGQDPAGGRYPYDRFDDMWAGLFAKLAADRLGWAVTSGWPSVEHSRASDAARNAEIEAPGIAVHEDLWPYLKDVSLAGAKTAAGCYRQFADAITGFRDEPYWRELGDAMRRWTALMEEAL
jgi:reversibly glycosylated polypeptide / UDP-arabinopyranose mutase